MRKAFIAFFSILSFFFASSPIQAVSIFNKSTQNPLLSSSENPNVLYKDGVYKMWYTTNYGFGWRINYAYSTNGIDGWTIPYQQIITPGTSDGFEVDTANPNVIFNDSLNLYQMWYSSVSKNWSGGDDRFRIGYATSPDGINWTKIGWALKGSYGSWDSGGPARGESVIFKNGIYQIWYSATNSGFNWRIGYATSTDGLNFVKQNNGIPVITPTEIWEQNNVEYPNVIFNNGTYEIFYASGFSDNTNQLVYATSTDGINWVKPSEKNPILIGGTSLDNINMTSPYVMRLDNGTSLMWYGGNVYNIMFASDGPLPSPTPPTTTSPTPSNTPIPSPTPTNSPTPTPTHTNKIIIVPGMGGSWNLKELDSCSYDPNNTNWGQTLEYYTPLQTRLANDGFIPYIFPYDWRRPISENGAKLEQFINGIAAANERINVVGHSMGGLVARWYLEHTKFSNKIDALLTVGTPHNGSNLSYPAWAAGEGWSNSIITRAMYSYIKFSCSVQKKYSAVETTHTMIPSFKNTLPVYNFLKDRKTNTIKQISSQIIQNDWLPTSYYGNPFYGVRVGSLAGFGYPTHILYTTNPPTKKEIGSGMWLDGKPISIDITNLGDGTVLNSSSYVTGAQNWTINLDHGALVRDISGINEISSFFSPNANAFSPLRMKIPDARNPHKRIPTSALMIISNSGHFTITDPKSTQITDANGLVLIEDPLSGKYMLQLSPDKNTTTISVGQILKDNKEIWKKYSLTGRTHLKFTIHFDHDHPREDPFEHR